MYKLSENGVTLTREDGSVLSIPNAEGNRHWREYQEWLAEGNTPEPEFTDEELAAKQQVERDAQEVSMRQARLALLAAGLLDDVETGITALDKAAQIEWEYATSVKRGSALVASIAAALSLSDDQLDDLFTAAAAL